MTHHRITLAAVTLGAALVGWLLSMEVNPVLRISFSDRAQIEVTPASGRQSTVGADAPVFHAVILPHGNDDRLLRLAAEDLVAALGARTGAGPELRTGGAASGRVVRVRVEPDEPPGESFRLTSGPTGLEVRAATALGAARGLGHLAGLLYAGAGDDDLERLSGVHQPALKHRFVDLGGVGIVPDSTLWRGEDYTHHLNPFAPVLLEEAPFVDAASLARLHADFRTFVDRMAVYGYNGLVLKGFLELVNFDYVGDGTEIYPADSPYRVRRTLLREAVGDMVAYADQMGMEVILYSDMLALSEPLENYLKARSGGIDAEDPDLWWVYRMALRELFESFPRLGGMMIRIGEAGTVYNVEGWRYYSSLDVTSVEAVRTMLSSLTEEARAHGKRMYFRSWSVGVGEVGGMHTDPDMFHRILDGLDAPGLVVSTKYVAGDYYSYLPLNATLMVGDQPRLVEMQARREFEFFASFPNYLAAEHAQALKAYLAANQSVDGIWMWSQEGGPQRKSPISLYPFHGFWQLIDADVYAAARIAWDPDIDMRTLTEGWVRRTFGGSYETVATIADVLLASREPVVKGLYIRPFAERHVRALGLEPPPMMWIFEWDILTGSSAALSAIYHVSRAEVEETIREGHEAVTRARTLRAHIEGIDVRSVSDPALLQRLEASLDYEINLLETLAAYREAILRYYLWVERGGRANFAAWKLAGGRAEAAQRRHLAMYDGDLDFRPLSFFDAGAGLQQASRARLMTWSGRLLLAAAIVLLLLYLRARPGERASGPLWSTAPRNPIGAPFMLVPDRGLLWFNLACAGVVVGTLLVTTSGRAPLTMLFGIGLGVSAIAARLTGSRQPLDEALFQFLGLLLLIVLVPLAMVSVRGPSYFWYHFWTSDAFRTSILVLSCVLSCWFFLALYRSFRSGADGRLASFSRVVLVAGFPVTYTGIVISLAGLERSLTVLNDELVVLPMGLSRILGITTHLNIPADLPGIVLAAGLVAGSLGLAGLWFGRRPGKLTRASAHSVQTA
jgi:hypothetical protein